MANTLQFKRSATAGKVPQTTDLALGEFAFNTADGRFYGKRNNGADEVVELLATTSAFKTNVAAATTGNIASLAGGAPNTVDGVSLALNSRVLVKSQTTAAQNGIYVVTTLGTGSNGTWARATDCDTAAEAAGAVVTASAGTVNGGQTFTNTFKSTDTLGTTAMSWSQLGAGGGGVSLSANNTWTGSNTYNGQVVFDATTYYPQVTAPAGSGRYFDYMTAGVMRWAVGANAAAESGANAGSNYVINRYNDAGSYIDTPFSIDRKTGLVLVHLDEGTVVGDGTAYTPFFINGAAGQSRSVILQTNGSYRWEFCASNGVESGSNAGSNFEFNSYDDSGSYLDTPLSINRATSLATVRELSVTKYGANANLRLNSSGGSGREWLHVSQTGGSWALYDATGANTILTVGANGNTLITCVDNGNTIGPYVTLFRESASPAANDALGSLTYTGRDSGGGYQEYASIYALAVSPTAGAESGALVFSLPNAGTVNTRLVLGSDGTLRTKQNASANDGHVVARHWCGLASNYTLTSTTSAQKLFNTTTNGALTLGTGVYEFELMVYVLSMSATSGNATVSLLGAGTATVDRVGQAAFGMDQSTPTTAAAVSGAVSVNTGTNIATAATGTGMFASIRGMFRVTAAGTIIPSISLATAAAAIVQANSYFKCAKVAESGETYVGAWS